MGVTRSPKIFGHDAHISRPERWLEAEGEQLSKMNSAVDSVFNSGKWQCAGRGIALIELNKVSVEMSYLARCDPSVRCNADLMLAPESF